MTGSEQLIYEQLISITFHTALIVNNYCFTVINKLLSVY